VKILLGSDFPGYLFRPTVRRSELVHGSLCGGNGERVLRTHELSGRQKISVSRKDDPEGVPYAFWRVTGDSGATLDCVPEVRAGVPSLP
jgi:hypothetical protein